MSPAESAARAAQWLQELVGELPGLRNATSRDPGFKNWRQNAITILQRIWPADQDHAERFRRIPFSPVDPRSDTRAQRESFSRGCQEAARVLNTFIAEVRAEGVPEVPGDVLATEESGFVDGFPTVDLPSGDLGESQDPEQAGLPSQVADPSFTPPAQFRTNAPPGTHAPPVHPESMPETRPARKGLGVAAKLRDLLGLTGFAGKPSPQQPAPTPTQGSGNSTAMPTRLPRALDIIPVGDEVNARPRSDKWPRPQPSMHAPGAPAGPAPGAPAPPAPATPGTGSTHESPPPQPGAAAPPAETGMSVVMSRPTTLRSIIEKVSIESLISPEFRGGAESGGASPSPATPPAAGSPTAPAAGTGSPSKILPLPLPPAARSAEPPAGDGQEQESPASSSPDSGELARATEDFMRSSPVLGATVRKAQHAPLEPAAHGFTDPDAIAILSMVDELTLMGVPVTRQSETRARLLDLARRIEAADLQWNALRKAVWFAMEYPELARRLLPMLLPWIDRAA